MYGFFNVRDAVWAGGGVGSINAVKGGVKRDVSGA